ncbi:MAG TPA: DUF4129 domain-containing protein [Flavobacteriaceae bacterium]|nr:DUF4129 domain-containing protein [Flavobacteriaceae bacterium]
MTYDRQARKPVEFSQNQLETYKNDPDFNYSETIQSENWWVLFKDWVARMWNKFWTWLLGSYAAQGIIALLLKALPYLIIAAIIGFAIWLFIKLNPAAAVLNEQKSAGVYLSEEEKILESEDIPTLIKMALAQKNYRSAIRYYYLLILKILRESKRIDYQAQKTNEEYLSEIEPIRLKNQFAKVTHLYDFIWYGDFPVVEPDFKKAENEFLHMTRLLNPNAVGKEN